MLKFKVKNNFILTITKLNDLKYKRWWNDLLSLNVLFVHFTQSRITYDVFFLFLLGTKMDMKAIREIFFLVFLYLSIEAETTKEGF